jgi:hypothetical protein
MVLRIYDLSTRAPLATLAVAEANPSNFVRGLAYDGEHLIVTTGACNPGGTYASTVWIYGISPDHWVLDLVWRDVALFPSGAAISGNQVSTDGHYIAVYDALNELRVLSREHALVQCRETIAGGSILSISGTSCDGHLLWALCTNPDRLYGLQIHPEGHELIRGDHYDHTKRPCNYALAQPR